MRTIRVGGLCLAALLLLPLGGRSERPLPLAAPEGATTPLTGFVYEQNGFRLAHVDPATLEPTASSEHVPGYAGGWVRSPDRSRVAVAVENSPGGPGSTLRLADAASLRWESGSVVLDGYFRAALWPDVRTIVAVVDDGSHVRVENVDLVAQRVVGTQSVAGGVAAVARADDSLAVLVRPAAKIGTARLLVVGSDGTVRRVALGDVRVGVSFRRSAGSDMIGTIRQPGLAVDPADGTAYVVEADGRITEIDLRSLAVREHRVARSLVSRLDGWLTPPAEAKGLNGPTRRATWLGDGLVAVTGSNQTALRTKQGAVVASGAPAGLVILDTRDWHTRMLDPRADTAVVAAGMLLATGASWRSGPLRTTNTGEGVAAYGAEGSLRWRFDDGATRWVAAVYDSLALVGRTNGVYDVIDVRTGSIVGPGIAGPVPQLLLGSGS